MRHLIQKSMQLLLSQTLRQSYQARVEQYGRKPNGPWKYNPECKTKIDARIVSGKSNSNVARRKALCAQSMGPRLLITFFEPREVWVRNCWRSIYLTLHLIVFRAYLYFRIVLFFELQPLWKYIFTRIPIERNCSEFWSRLNSSNFILHFGDKMESEFLNEDILCSK